jgi:hypothetical protein
MAHRKRHRDFNQAAKLVVDIATGQVEDRPPTSGSHPCEALAARIDVSCLPYRAMLAGSTN